MKIKQASAFLLLLATLFLSLFNFVGCGEKKEEETTEKPGDGEIVSEMTEETSIPYEDTIPERDYGGYPFTILVSTQQQPFFIAEAEVTDIINDAVFNRNEKVSETFNITLDYQTMDGNSSGAREFATAIRSSLMADDQTYDIVIPQTYYGVSLALENSYFNLKKSEYLHLNEKWWFQRINEEATISDRLYFSAGSFLMDKLNSLMCVFFNANHLQDLRITDNLYQMVNDGQWTLEKLVTYSKAYSENYSDPTVTDQTGFYGHVSDAHGIRALIVGGDVPILTRNETNTNSLSITYYGNRLINVFDDVYDFINGDSAWWTESYEIPATIFTDGRALFYTHHIGKMLSPEMRDMADKYGVLPIPKYDEEQKEYCSAAMRWDMMSVMRNCDTERACIIMENLCYNTDEILIPEYWEKSMQLRYSRDTETSEMLEKIRRTLYFPFTDIYKAEIGDIGEGPVNLIKSKSATLSSWWAENVDTYKLLLRQLVDNVNNIPEN